MEVWHPNFFAFFVGSFLNLGEETSSNFDMWNPEIWVSALLGRKRWVFLWGVGWESLQTTIMLDPPEIYQPSSNLIVHALWFPMRSMVRSTHLEKEVQKTAIERLICGPFIACFTCAMLLFLAWKTKERNAEISPGRARQRCPLIALVGGHFSRLRKFRPSKCCQHLDGSPNVADEFMPM